MNWKQHLQSEDESERLEALHAIRDKGADEHLTFLVERLEEEPSSRVLVELLELLAHEQCSEALPQIEGFLTDKRAALRVAAIHAVGCLGDSRAIARLRPALVDPSHRVRTAAAIVLSDSGKLDTRDFLRSLLAAQNDREAMLSALSVIRGIHKGWHYHDIVCEIHERSHDESICEQALALERSFIDEGTLQVAILSAPSTSSEDRVHGTADEQEDSRQLLDAATVGFLLLFFGVLLIQSGWFVPDSAREITADTSSIEARVVRLRWLTRLNKHAMARSLVEAYESTTDKEALGLLRRLEAEDPTALMELCNGPSSRSWLVRAGLRSALKYGRLKQARRLLLLNPEIPGATETARRVLEEVERSQGAHSALKFVSSFLRTAGPSAELGKRRKLLQKLVAARGKGSGTIQRR